jgi:hypothetical protein
VKFWVVWGFDAVIAAVLLFFFAVGLGDGSVSARNIGLWLLILAGVTAVVGGGFHLRSKGRAGLGLALLMVLAIPGFLYAFFLLAVLIGRPRWN